MDIHLNEGWYAGPGLWGFVILIVLIGSFFSYMKTRSRNEVIREALRAGQPLDPAVFDELKNGDDKGGLIIGGLILMAVASGLLILGYQIGVTDGDKEIFGIMKGVAAIPGLIGVVLFIAGLVQAMIRPRGDK